MIFSLIICTYQRPSTLIRLLNSVKTQTLYPKEIIVVDGSVDNATTDALKTEDYENLSYFKISEAHRGLTKQRNYGIKNVSEEIEVVCFLDDDTVLQKDYFQQLIKGFSLRDDAIGFGGVATNENRWFNPENKNFNLSNYYEFDGCIIEESSRNKLRKQLGLQSHLLPGFLPEYSHANTYSYPITGKIYETEMIVGMSMAFKRELFNHINFSSYFEGYGLYEDADFCFRALKYGKNYINTNAQLEHHHEPSGRPNQYKYGKMVVRNGWYVWRVRWPKPSFKAKIKWHAITLLLTLIRFTNVFTTKERAKAFSESTGRLVGWLSLLFNKPNIER